MTKKILPCKWKFSVRVPCSNQRQSHALNMEALHAFFKFIIFFYFYNNNISLVVFQLRYLKKSLKRKINLNIISDNSRKSPKEKLRGGS